MPRIVTADDLRAKLGRELDALRESEEALYVSKRGRLAGVLLDPERYAELIERLEYLEDSLAALQAREERHSLSWSEVRTEAARPNISMRSVSTRRRLGRIGVFRVRSTIGSQLPSIPLPAIHGRSGPPSSPAAIITGFESASTGSCTPLMTTSAS